MTQGSGFWPSSFTNFHVKWKWKSLSPVRLFATPWTVACQASLSRPEYQLPCTSGKLFFPRSPSFPVCRLTLTLSVSSFQIWLMSGSRSRSLEDWGGARTGSRWIWWRAGAEGERELAVLEIEPVPPALETQSLYHWTAGRSSLWAVLREARPHPRFLPKFRPQGPGTE